MEEMNTLDPVSEGSHPACDRFLPRYGKLELFRLLV